jgi:hypothetical protein
MADSRLRHPERYVSVQVYGSVDLRSLPQDATLGISGLNWGHAYGAG